MFVNLRRAYELEKAKDLVELGKAHASSNLVLSVGEQEKYVQLRGRVTALEHATQQIDSCILLFEHFLMRKVRLVLQMLFLRSYSNMSFNTKQEQYLLISKNV